MQNLNHSRKTSLHYTVRIPQPQSLPQTQLCFAKSTKDSPQNTNLHWLRSTHRPDLGRVHSDQKANHHPNHPSSGHRAPLQTGDKKIAKLKPLFMYQNLSLQSALYIMQTAIRQCSAHHMSTGSSYFNVKNCYVNQEQQLVIKFYMGKFCTPSFDEVVVVRDIVEGVYKLCQLKVFDDFYAYYKRLLGKSRCDFKFTISLIKSYCSCSKITIANKIKYNNINGYNMKGQRDKSEHPKSAQKISPFVLQMITSKITRKKSSCKERDSFHVKIFDSRAQPHQKIVSRQLFVENSEGKKPTINTKISIKPQFNVVVSPKLFNLNNIMSSSNNEDLTLSCKKDDGNGKISTVSTNFNSSLHHGDNMEISNINLKSKLSVFSQKNSENKQHFSFLPADLDQVQSLGQSSDQQSQLPTRRFQTPRDTHLQNIKRQNQNRILTINNWTRRLSGLLSQQRDIKQSFTEETNKQNLNTKSYESDPENLRRMVRTVVESILPVPSQFLIKHS